MKKVGSFEAKTHLSALLLDAERGETITITKKGRPVAQLGPIKSALPARTPAEAMKKLLSMKVRLRGIAVRDLIDEGRRR